MKVGMLWMDGSKEAGIEDRIQGAANYYKNKYAEHPNVCFVHPSTAAGNIPKNVGRLSVKMNKAVIPGHFWIGIKETETSRK
jgi:hypothetical protein